MEKTNLGAIGKYFGQHWYLILVSLLPLRIAGNIPYLRNKPNHSKTVQIGKLKERMNDREGATCNSTSWSESGPESVKATRSFSLRPSHKQHPGLE